MLNTEMASGPCDPLRSTLLFFGIFVFVSAGQNIITAESGKNVTLPGRAPNNNIPIIVVEWSRADLENKYVLLFRDERYYPDNQHPAFKDRVDLQDRQMKDGDVSLILKNVTTADAGTYECRVAQRGTNRRKRANLKTEPISIINLSVAPPPGPSGGTTEDGGYVGLIVGLSVAAVLLLVVVGLLIYRKKQQDPYHPPAQQQAV